MKLLNFALCLLAVTSCTGSILIAEEDEVAREGRSDGKQKPRFLISEAIQPQGFPAPAAVGTIVVKDYPAYRAARVTAAEIGQNAMFRRLFNHIKQNGLAMIAPVEMTYDASGPTSMAFLYGKPIIGETGNQEGVQVIDVPAAKVASIGVRGKFTTSTFERHHSMLDDWLKQHSDQWAPAGEPRYFGFNSPFVPEPLRYGEVQIPIKQVAPAQQAEAKNGS